MPKTLVAKTDGGPPALPTSDAYFVFEGTDSMPEWADKGWISWDRGPALAVPVGDVLDTVKPYATAFAHIGDEVRFVAATGSVAPHFEVIPGTPEPGLMTKRVAQESAAPVEDLLKGGLIGVEDLSEADKARLSADPGMRKIIEGEVQIKRQSIAERVVSE